MKAVPGIVNPVNKLQKYYSLAYKVEHTFFVLAKQNKRIISEPHDTSFLHTKYYSYWNVFYLVKMRNLSRNSSVVIKQRWFLKIVWEKFVVKQFAFFYVRIVKGPKTNIFTCKLCRWVIFIILFTRLLCDNSNFLTYEPRKGAKSNTFTCQLCDSTSHADWLFTIIIVTWTYEDLFRLVTNAFSMALVTKPMPFLRHCLLRSNSF